MATVKPTEAEPRLTDITINYSVGMKANIGNYENAQAGLSKTEKWDVSGLTTEQAQEFFDSRYDALQEDLGDKMVEKFGQMRQGEL